MADLDLDRKEAVAKAGAAGDLPLTSYISVFHPHAVLAMIAALRAKDARIAEQDAQCVALGLEIKALTARAERAKADAAEMRAVVEAALEWEQTRRSISCDPHSLTPHIIARRNLTAALAALEPTPKA